MATSPSPVGLAEASPKPLDHQPDRKFAKIELDETDPFSNGNISPITRDESVMISRLPINISTVTTSNVMPAVRDELCLKRFFVSTKVAISREANARR